MYCINCGVKLADTEHICPLCGTEVFHPELMRENLLRVKGELDWCVMKNDYRNAGKEWKNARDAVSRGMQKLQGGHPADPVFRSSDYGIKIPGK